MAAQEQAGAPAYPMSPRVPAHVPASLVYDYDVYRPGPEGSDFFAELFRLKAAAPPVFWTPYNGGHWYVADAALTEKMLRDPARFSSQALMLPRESNPPKGQGFTPIHLDPPEHGIYRALMFKALTRHAVTTMLPDIRATAIALIEALKPRGGCEFVADFAFRLPTTVFLRLVDLPEDYHDGLRSRVSRLVDAASDKAELFAGISDHLAPFVHERMRNPGDDLISWLARQEIDGAPVSEARLLSMTNVLLVAGLDTVANTFAFIARFLADNPTHRQWIRDNPKRLNMALIELLRRFPVVTAGAARLCVESVMLGDAPIAAGDMMLAVPAMINFDEADYPNPLTVDFERRVPNLGTFGQGPHKCLGASIATAQLGIFIEEWLARIPDFHVAPGPPPRFRPGVTYSYDRLMLEWPIAG